MIYVNNLSFDDKIKIGEKDMTCRQGCATILTFHMWHCFLPIGTSFGVFQIGTDLGFAELGQVLDLALFPSFGLAKSEISRRTKFWALPRRKFQTGTRFGFCGKWAKFMRMARQWRQPPFVSHHPNIITGVNILAESSLLLPSQLRDLVDFLFIAVEWNWLKSLDTTNWALSILNWAACSKNRIVLASANSSFRL